MATTTTTSEAVSALKGDQITSPPLSSLCACNKHEKFRECVAYANASYAESLEPIAMVESSTPHSQLPMLGLCTAFLYPRGDFERLPVTIDGYMAFLFLDDLIDNSTDMRYISEIVVRFMATCKGTPIDDARFFLLARFMTDKRWDPTNLAEAVAEAQRFMDGALALRAIEVEKRTITVEEYLEIRLTEDFNRLMAENPDLWARVEQPSGRSVGIALDLYKLNGSHAEICEYTNVVKIWQRELSVSLDLSDAIEFMVDEFYRYEKEMADAVDELAKVSPDLAQAVRDVQGGTLKWMTGERGGRYSKI
ncbi:hypothetical protein K491DRAFT_719753 [Lophiostoma macrostomum CBS 122681]|uniref:Terpenoid synthase n=1 Tax=Lophiostoma macrostomum CBS 122681 TaxID=1314788 RepID=A0A6A6SX57_9PLEO|nr:hypothetical protein K491DRAFT_719753 [Lophiostoma macrostomum CBS 122681]